MHDLCLESSRACLGRELDGRAQDAHVQFGFGGAEYFVEVLVALLLPELGQHADVLKDGRLPLRVLEDVSQDGARAERGPAFLLETFQHVVDYGRLPNSRVT